MALPEASAGGKTLGITSKIVNSCQVTKPKTSNRLVIKIGRRKNLGMRLRRIDSAFSWSMLVALVNGNQHSSHRWDSSIGLMWPQARHTKICCDVGNILLGNRTATIPAQLPR
jgi:hypothetical protein